MLSSTSSVQTRSLSAHDDDARRLRAALESVAVWLIPAIAAGLVGWWGINAANISRDETATIGISTRTLPDLWRMVQHADAVHALYYLIMHFWTAAFGISPLALRLPSLIGMVIGAALLAALGRMLVSPRAGLTAGLLYACAPQASYYAHDARSYGIDSTLVILLFLVFVRAMRSPRRSAWIGYAVTLLVTVAMHLFTLLVLVAHGITVVLDARSNRSWQSTRRWLVAAALATGALVPFILWSVIQGDTANWIPPPTWIAVWDFVIGMAGRASLIVPFAVFATLAIRMSSQRPTVMTVALPWLAVPPVLMFVGSIFDPLYVFRYLLYCLPAIALLVAAGLDRLGPWTHGIALLTLVALTVPQQLAVRNPDQGANDFRAEAAYINANKRSGDGIFFLVPTQRPLANSDRGAYAGLNDIALAMTPAQAANFSGTDLPPAEVEQRLGAVDRIWAVKFWVSNAQLPAAHEQESQQYAMLKIAGLRWVSTRHFRGGAILLFVRGASSSTPPALPPVSVRAPR